MIRLLQWFIIGHIHKWKTIQETKLQDRIDDPSMIGTRYIQQCETCGIVKKRDMI